MPDLTLVRGDGRTLAISGLSDENGSPAVFDVNDIVIFTIKADYAHTAAEALIVKTTQGGGITLSIGGSTATIAIVPADWDSLFLRGDLPFVWDLQLDRDGDPTMRTTLDSGDGVVTADVTANPTIDPSPSGGIQGPCTPWTTVGAVQADPRAYRADGSPLLPGLLQTKIDVASELLYRLSGRQFAGVCTDIVRPTMRWYRVDDDMPQTPWSWWGRWPDRIETYTSRDPHRWDGNTSPQEITLGAYPLRQILEVRANGQVIPSAAYRIDNRRTLVNLDERNYPWPVAQDMTADPATDDNTFQVTFEYGQAPNQGGVDACIRYAIELAKGACGDPCQLPERVLSMQMQGVSYAVLDPMTFLDKGKTGIYEVDMWLQSVNPNGLRRRSTVLTPDRPRPVRRTAVTPGS